MSYNKLPADPIAIILGIISIILALTSCCCYGLPAILTLIIAIIGLVYANNSLREYRANPENYSQQSLSSVNTGRVINIIAVVLNSIVLIVGIILITYGITDYNNIYKEFENNSYENDSYYDYEIEETDSYDDEDEVYEIIEEEVEVEEVENDSI